MVMEHLPGPTVQQLRQRHASQGRIAARARARDHVQRARGAALRPRAVRLRRQAAAGRPPRSVARERDRHRAGRDQGPRLRHRQDDGLAQPHRGRLLQGQAHQDAARAAAGRDRRPARRHLRRGRDVVGGAVGPLALGRPGRSRHRPLPRLARHPAAAHQRRRARGPQVAVRAGDPRRPRRALADRSGLPGRAARATWSSTRWWSRAPSSAPSSSRCSSRSASASTRSSRPSCGRATAVVARPAGPCRCPAGTATVAAPGPSRTDPYYEQVVLEGVPTRFDDKSQAAGERPLRQDRAGGGGDRGVRRGGGLRRPAHPARLRDVGGRRRPARRRRRPPRRPARVGPARCRPRSPRRRQASDTAGADRPADRGPPPRAATRRQPRVAARDGKAPVGSAAGGRAACRPGASRSDRPSGARRRLDGENPYGGDAPPAATPASRRNIDRTNPWQVGGGK